MEISRYGESAIRILFGDSINVDINAQVRKFYFYIKSLAKKEIIDVIPSFCSCIIIFDNRLISFAQLVSDLQEKEQEMNCVDLPDSKILDVPVEYGGVNGSDMGFVSSYAGLSVEEIIAIHTATIYTVFAVGFLPGFVYLGPLDPRLCVPRLETPRVRIPEGSVGLAQMQTGIYPFESPAGWRIIGRTKEQLFNYRNEPFSRLQIGDRVKFGQI
jgi:KipI family sensor histidine kinase inhibitor